LKDSRFIFILALLPGLFWTGGIDTAAALRRAGIQQFSAPAASVDAWRLAGFQATPLSEEALRGRVKLTTPGIDRKVRVASATTAPWVNANGWQFLRRPDREYWYEPAARSAALAAAEAYAYGAKVVMKIDPADLDSLGKMLQFLRSVPDKAPPGVDDFGFVDNGSDLAAEQLNLLSRRNLLYKVVNAPDSKLRLNVASNDDDPHLFAAKVRERLTDDQRSLRVYGSEVVLCRVVGGAAETRVHVLNYGRPLEGVRLRVRGTFARGKLYGSSGGGQLADFSSSDGFTEFSLPELGTYAVVDLTR
jgi:hypothetical protein